LFVLHCREGGIREEEKPFFSSSTFPHREEEKRQGPSDPSLYLGEREKYFRILLFYERKKKS